MASSNNYKRGDINNDNKIGTLDATYILKHLGNNDSAIQ